MNFNGFILPLLLILIVATIIPLVIKKLIKKDKEIGYPFRKNDKLLSPAERSFYGILNQVIDNDKLVLTKVRLADVISVKNGLSKSNWQRAFNRISSKHVDFLICNSSDLTIECAIELDDKTHLAKSRQSRDNFLERALNTANLPLIRIKASNSYSIEEVKNLIFKSINNGLDKESILNTKLIDSSLSTIENVKK